LSTKPEVHNVLHGRQMWTKPQRQLITTCRVTSCNLDMRFLRLDLRVDRQTDIQTDIQIHSSQYFTPLPWAK